MAGPGANIHSNEAIRHFRVRFVKFHEASMQAVESTRLDVARVSEWLDREKRAYWERELRKRHDELELARSELLRADQEDKYHRKSSAVEERKALERAKRRKEEAEDKLEKIKRWTTSLDQRATNLFRPCANLTSLLGHITPQALARLDRMLESLDAYRQMAASVPPPASPAPNAPAEGGPK